MEKDDRVNELCLKLKETLLDFLSVAINSFFKTDERALDIAGELTELGYSEPIEIQPRMRISLAAVGPEKRISESESSVPPHLDWEISSQDLDFARALKINLEDGEQNDMRGVLKEVKKISTDAAQKEKSDPGEAQPDDNRNEAQIIQSILYLAKRFNNFFKRHLFVFSINNSKIYKDLKIGFPKDKRAVLQLVDDALWIKKVQELVNVVMGPNVVDKKAYLKNIEFFLIYYKKLEL